MIPIEKLLAVKTIIAHKNNDSPCPDGVAAALILRDALPDAVIKFASHDDLRTMEPKEVAGMGGVLFCDVTPPAERANAWCDESVIVLDHHKSARAVVESFGELGVFADEEKEPGVSGAMLAFREVWLPLSAARSRDFVESMEAEGVVARVIEEDPEGEHVRRFAELAGVRDTWQKASPLWADACAQAEALRFWPFYRWPRNILSSPRGLSKMMAVGDIVVANNRARDLSNLERGFRFISSRGLRVVVVSTLATSDLADLATEEDLVVGFAYDGAGPRIQLSLRSRGKFDCARFCQMRGGGGHTQAAGCRIELRADSPHPYSMIQRLLETYERNEE